MEHQGGGGAGELYERKEVGAPDNSGVYEMQGGELPVQMGELESPHVPHAPHVQE